MGAGGAIGYYGSFYSTIDQTAVINTNTPITFNQTALSNGVTVLGSQIQFANTGVYDIQFSAQFHHTGGGGPGNTVDVWFRQNGVDIPDSSTKVTVPSNTPYIVAAWDLMVSVTAGTFVELMWRTDNANIVIESEPLNANHPAVPSVILTVMQVMYSQVGPTGPTGPTGPAGDWSTAQTLRSVTGASDIPTSADNGRLITIDTASGAVSVTVDAALGLLAGQRIDFVWVGAATSVTFVGSGVTLNGTPGLKLRAQYSAGTVLCLASNTYVLVGDLSA